MEHRLRLVKGLSYSGAVYATKENPYVSVGDGERYRAAMASGYFEEAPAEAPMQQGAGPGDNGQEGAEAGTPIDRMTLDELKAYALVGGIDISGLRRKDDILSAVKAAEEKAAEAREALRMG